MCAVGWFAMCCHPFVRARPSQFDLQAADTIGGVMRRDLAISSAIPSFLCSRAARQWPDSQVVTDSGHRPFGDGRPNTTSSSATTPPPHSSPHSPSSRATTQMAVGPVGQRRGVGGANTIRSVTNGAADTRPGPVAHGHRAHRQVELGRDRSRQLLALAAPGAASAGLFAVGWSFQPELRTTSNQVTLGDAGWCMAWRWAGKLSGGPFRGLA